LTAVTAAATEMLYALLLVKLVKYLVCFCYTVFVAEVTMTIKGRKNTSGDRPRNLPLPQLGYHADCRRCGSRICTKMGPGRQLQISLNVIGINAVRSITYYFLLAVHNYGPLFCTVSEITGDIGGQLQIFCTPPVFIVPVESVTIIIL